MYETKATLNAAKAFKGFYQNPYAWPGGYPVFAVMNDEGTLCHKCFTDRENPVHVGGCADGWRFEAQAINWENANLYCDHCADRIESAYGD